MDLKWWLATLVVPVLLIIVGAVIAYVRYRLELRRFYGREVFSAGSALLMALHLLNNAHQGQDDFKDDIEEFKHRARAARDEVWRHQSQLQLVGSAALIQATDALVSEYNSSSPDRGRPSPIDRAKRKELRTVFIAQWRRECPGLPGGARVPELKHRKGFNRR